MCPVNEWVQVAALLAAGSFFAWKLLTGWLFVNLKVGLKLERVEKNAFTDHMAIILLLEKGPTDSVWLNHIEARITSPLAPKEQRIDMSSETRRLQVYLKKMVWDQVENEGRSIALSSGETTTIARFAEISSQCPVQVEVLIFGGRTFWRRTGFQWRASAVSLPMPSVQNRC